MARSRQSGSHRRERRGCEANDRARGEAGFGLVEMIVGSTLLAVLAIVFAASLFSTMKAFTHAKSRTVASQLATRQIEEVRSLPYADVGLVAGNPPGLLAATSQSTVAGVVYTTTIDVSFVNDPLPGGFQTFANYKAVTVNVTSSLSSEPVASFETIVAPPTQPSLTKGVIKVQVVDYASNTPVVGATVDLSAGPDIPRTDSTPTDGIVTFAALTPNPSSGSQSHYQLDVSVPGYEVLPEDRPPGNAARTQLGAGQLFSTVIRVYKPSTLEVELRGPGGQPFSEDAIITVASDRGAGVVATASGTASINSVAGDYIVPSVEYSVSARDDDVLFSGTFRGVVPETYPHTLSLVLDLAAGVKVDLDVSVKDAQTSTKITGARVDVIGGPLDVTLTGTSDGNGKVRFAVPKGSEAYTIVVPAQGIYDEGELITTVTAAKSVTVNVPRA